jgi:ADP-ribosylglycohydrolase
MGRECDTQLGYDLSRTLGAIGPGYKFDVTCQGSVPEAITAFLESDSVESAIRLVISLAAVRTRRRERECASRRFCRLDSG